MPGDATTPAAGTVAGLSATKRCFGSYALAGGGSELGPVQGIRLAKSCECIGAFCHTPVKCAVLGSNMSFQSILEDKA